MSLKLRITDDMKQAMRERDKDRLKTIRLMLAAMKQIEVDKRIELDDAAVLVILNKLVKQRRESIRQYEDAERDDLAAVEYEEIDIIQTYLPQPLTQEAVDALVQEAMAATGANTMRDMGKVMAYIKPKAEGRADIGAISTTIKNMLG